MSEQKAHIGELFRAKQEIWSPTYMASSGIWNREKNLKISAFTQKRLLKIPYFQLQFTFDIILYWFQVHRMVARQSYILQNVTPDISSTYLAPYIFIITFFTVFPMLYFISPHKKLFNGSNWMALIKFNSWFPS